TGCVTTSPVPSSPFLTAVAAAAAKASPSVMNANAAATDDVATSSTSRPANTPSPSQPNARQQNGSTGAADTPPVAGAADRKEVYPQIARASGNMVEAFAAAGLRASMPAE